MASLSHRLCCFSLLIPLGAIYLYNQVEGVLPDVSESDKRNHVKPSFSASPLSSSPPPAISPPPPTLAPGLPPPVSTAGGLGITVKIKITLGGVAALVITVAVIAAPIKSMRAVPNGDVEMV